MANVAGKAYGLTALIPIKHGQSENTSYDKQVRDQLYCWPRASDSPMAKIPNTYLCRFYLLNDVFYQGKPAVEEHLNNHYLVYESNFHGDPETYLAQAWEQATEAWQQLLKYCVAFDKVQSPTDFVSYIKRCQINNNLFFNGSNDKSLAEQLKALFLKQSLSHFCFFAQEFQIQGELGERRLQDAFRRYTDYTQPDNLQQPTWPIAAIEEPKNLRSDIAAIIDKTKEVIQ